MIEFHLDPASGVAPYLQLVQQVRRAIKLGLLEQGDQLPTAREVVRSLAINPNTVFKAYRELEHEGLASGRAGVGTFVTASPEAATVSSLAPLRAALAEWLARARADGLDDDSIEALIAESFPTRRALGVR